MATGSSPTHDSTGAECRFVRSADGGAATPADVPGRVSGVLPGSTALPFLPGGHRHRSRSTVTGARHHMAGTGEQAVAVLTGVRGRVRYRKRPGDRVFPSRFR